MTDSAPVSPSGELRAPRVNPLCVCGHDADHHPVQGRTTKFWGGCSRCPCDLFHQLDPDRTGGDPHV